eukprot:g39215.t1
MKLTLPATGKLSRKPSLKKTTTGTRLQPWTRNAMPSRQNVRSKASAKENATRKRPPTWTKMLCRAVGTLGRKCSSEIKPDCRSDLNTGTKLPLCGAETTTLGKDHHPEWLEATPSLVKPLNE